jgi:hypothetical protein
MHYSRLSLSELEKLPANELRPWLYQRGSLVATFIALASILLFFAPLVGLVLGIIGLAMNYKSGGWPKVASIVAIVLAALVTLYAICDVVKTSIAYSFRADFAEMPADDVGLSDWLRSQPGVIRRTVSVSREPNAIRVHWIMSRNLLGNPPIPDFEQRFSRLGYKGQKSLQRGI